MRYMEYVKRTVPMHDDLYDFFLQELPGYDMVGYRDTDLVCWGCFDDPDYVDYDYRNMTEWGQHAVHHAGPRVQGRADHDRPGRDQPGDADPARQLVLRRLDERGDVRHARPARQPGRQAPPVEQGDAAEAAEARLGRQVQLGRVAAHVRQAQRHLRRLRHRRRPVRPPVGDGEGRPGRHRLPEGHRPQHPDGAAEDRRHARDGARVEGAGEVERDRARPRPHLPPGLLGAGRPALPGEGAGRGPRRPHEELERLQGAGGGRQRRLPRGRPRRAVAPHGDPRRQDRELPAVPADAVEREPARHLRDARPLRGRGAEHADLRGERARELQGHRHHAGRADASTRACRAACTCTPAPGKVRKVVHRPTGLS